MKKLVMLIVLLVAAMAACTPATTPDAEQPAPDIEALPTRETGMPENAEPVPTTVEQAEELEAMPTIPADSPAVGAAVGDLAGRLDVAAADVEVLRYEPVTWSDGSLGCPQPDVMYTQALVEGVFIQLRVGDEVYNYHGSNNGDPTLCESAAAVAPGELPPGAVSSGS